MQCSVWLKVGFNNDKPDFEVFNQKKVDNFLPCINLKLLQY